MTSNILDLAITCFVGLIIATLLVFLFVWYLRWGECRYNQMDNAITADEKNNADSVFLPPRYLVDSLKYVGFWAQYYLIKYADNFIDYFPKYNC